MSTENESETYAFLSSTIGRPGDDRRDIRKAIDQLALPRGMTVWADELEEQKPSTLRTVDRLFQLIRGCSVMVVILFDSSFGSSVPVSDQDETAVRAHSSFWEAELFYAALIGTPVEIFVVDGFQPEPKLAELLKLLEGALSSSHWRGPYKKERLVREVHRVLRRYALQPWPAFTARTSALLVEGLFNHRGRDMSGGHAERESCQLLGGPYYDPTVHTDESVVRSLLAGIESGTHTDGDALDEEGRLGRLWLVFRELSGVSFDSPDHIDLLQYWNALFGHWCSAGAWYGLHGHTYFGVLPAAVAQARIREGMRNSSRPGQWDDAMTRYPGGSIASARYSIARKTGSAITRHRVLEAALKDLEREAAEGQSIGEGHLSVRGSVHRQLGNIDWAVADYEESLRLRENRGASESTLGIALSELGYAYLIQRKFTLGRSYLLEGVKLLNKAHARPGFLIRAKRKLAIGHMVKGHPLLAWNEISEARTLAKSTKAYDQLRWY